MNDEPKPYVSRRTLLAGATAATILGVAPARSAMVRSTADSGGAMAVPPAGTPSEITAHTIVEAEKLIAVRNDDTQREVLARTLPAQVSGVEALHTLPLPLELQPACMFNPRLPGVAYRTQANRLELVDSPIKELPARDVDIAFAPVTSLAHWIRGRKLTSRRLTEIYLERIARIDRQLYSFITVTPALALAQADQADREVAAGRYRGPLHGIPYGVKDVFDTAGIATTWGAALYRDRVPANDAAVVTKLRDNGAVLLGKLATGELANGVSWFGGMCRNPWNPEEPAGGSSCGPAAATAAGLCAFAIGTDSLGSILNPADRCGITGLRPTYGRVPVAGGMPLTPSLERIGPLTRCVEDAAVVLAAIHGPDAGSAGSFDPGFEYQGSRDLAELKVGYSPAWFKRIGFGGPDDTDVRPPHLHALEQMRTLGVRLVEVELPDLPYALLLNLLYVESASIFANLTLSGADSKLLNREDYSWPFGWRRARLLSAVDYYTLDRFRTLVMHEMHKLFERVDMLFAPTYGSFAMFMVMNFTGHPGVSFLAGRDQLPTRAVGPRPLDLAGPLHEVTQNVSLHGRLYEEGAILRVAHALERRLAVAPVRPPTG
jgi:Asp-tRNA(Asn)/Glu-tRNA(Gln) amidotransferase A subunit family amidase